jgi:membrane-bound lytic murein transglycosylase MltF
MQAQQIDWLNLAALAFKESTLNPAHAAPAVPMA